MESRSSFLAVGVYLLLVLHTASAGAEGRATIKLEGVPDRLEFPIARGRNLVLTATVKGGVARSVWLARQSGDSGRVMLTAVDESIFQINLVDPAVGRLLKSGGQGGKFQMFAELEDGRVIATIPVFFSEVYRDLPSPLVYLIAKDGKAEQLDHWSEDSEWLDPEAIMRIELRHSEQPPILATTECAGRIYKFDRLASGSLVLPMTKELREAWRKQVILELRYRHGGTNEKQRIAKNLYCVPQALVMKGNVLRLTIRQRRSAPIPGSYTFLRVRVGDITRGQMMLSLTDGMKKQLIGEVSAKRGDVFSFDLGLGNYHLAVDALVNQLIGADHCELAVFDMQPAVRAKIEAALRALASAEVKVLIAGKEMIAKQGADRIRKQFENEGPRVETFKQFLKQFAATAKIKSPDGKIVPATKWLSKAEE